MLDTLSQPPEIDAVETTAGRSASRNFLANLAALESTQPRVIDDVEPISVDVEWIHARDGVLTALDAGGQWWGGCSLPARAAEFMLRKADLSGTVVCFLGPAHAAQVRHSLDRMLPGQALLALVPELTTLRIILACDDFSGDILSHRLYFAWGPKWEAELDRLLEDLPGLPTPTQFIRPILADSSPADVLVEPAQKVFADHTHRRSQTVRSIREKWAGTGLKKICLVAPSHFRLWDDIGDTLAGAMAEGSGDISLVRFDPDDPSSASGAALAAAAASCDAIVTPNTGRAHLPDLIPDEMPWATWLTIPRIPAADKAGINDTLLVCDPNWKELAIACGWKAGQVFVADWPRLRQASVPAENPSVPGVYVVRPEACLAIIADTRPLNPPDRVTEYSSHRLLWEAIAEELLKNPLAASESAADYLTDRMKQLRVAEEGFDRSIFLDGVVLHAYQQGLARLLLSEKMPLKIFGNGWDRLDEFGDRAAGAIRSREQLAGAVAGAAGLVHVWPIAHGHPIESAGKPVVRPGRKRDAFLRDARQALVGKLVLPARRTKPISGEIVFRALSIRQQ